MTRYRLRRQLRALDNEGKELAKKAEERVENSAVILWLASVSDILKLVLPEESAIFAEFQTIRQKGPANKEVYQKEEVQDLVANVSHILSKARQVNLIQPRNPESSESQELEREMRLIINEFYFRWPWFYVPIGILVVVIGLAVLGVIQIRDLKIDFRETAKNAIEEAKQNIDRKTDEVRQQIDGLGGKASGAIATFKEDTTNRLNSELNAYVESEKGRVSRAANDHIEKLKLETKPEWNKELARVTVNVERVESQAKSLQEKFGDLEKLAEPRVKPLQEKLGNLEKQMTSLQVAVQEISSDTNHGLLQSIGIVWALSPFFILGMIASGIALLLSIVALFKRK